MREKMFYEPSRLLFVIPRHNQHSRLTRMPTMLWIFRARYATLNSFNYDCVYNRRNFHAQNRKAERYDFWKCPSRKRVLTLSGHQPTAQLLNCFIPRSEMKLQLYTALRKPSIAPQALWLGYTLEPNQPSLSYLTCHTSLCHHQFIMAMRYRIASVAMRPPPGKANTASTWSFLHCIDTLLHPNRYCDYFRVLNLSGIYNRRWPIKGAMRWLAAAAPSYPSKLRCSMKLALLSKMLFHESALKAKMALTLRRASSVTANRCERLDLLYNPEWEESLGCSRCANASKPPCRSITMTPSAEAARRF